MGAIAVITHCIVVVSYFFQASASHILGISPQEEKYYLDGALIACKDGSKSFPRNRLNDGFCDCPDGTDEPGTSACPESKFYCKNVGDTPRFLFSSRVNDLICDCCDGSDEYDGGITCLNTCNKDENDQNTRIDEQDLTKTKSNDINAQERISRRDLEDFIQNLKGFRVAIIVEFVVAMCLITFFLFYRRSRARRRRLLRRNPVCGGLRCIVLSIVEHTESRKCAAFLTCGET